ncbi:MAG: IS1595 family transposase [Leptolyngbyaceae cyanobacterium RU_5_1]|nr:IS1595 family transposase [Leptolyngbyaceae cyanobacterium RU_5_1]
MEFPITNLLDRSNCTQWIIEHFHPSGFGCKKCGAGVEQSRKFRTTRRRQLTVYRCRQCNQTYNLYSGTLFEQHHLTPEQIVLLIRGVFKGESSRTLAAELGLSYQTVLHLRHQLHNRAQALQPETPLPDCASETDEMFQNAGEKGDKHGDPFDPPRRRANKRPGKGTDDNERPPIVGTVGRETGHVRRRVVNNTTGQPLVNHVDQFTVRQTQLFTDESASYNHVIRNHATVCHSQNEWARDDDGDGIREVHVNTVEGLWTDVRNFLRPFKGVHKDYLSGYVAIFEFNRNLKRLNSAFIASLVNLHTFRR